MKLISWQKRPFIYALIITLGYFFLYYIIHNVSLTLYVIGVFVLYMLVLFELYYTIKNAKKHLSQLGFKEVDASDKLTYYLHHILLPSLLFFSLALFLFFHRQYIAVVIAIFVSFVLFFALFINVRAYYQDEFKIVVRTNYIYDFICILGVFVFTDSVLNIFNYFELNRYYALIPIFVVLLSVSTLIGLRYRLIKKFPLLLGIVIVALTACLVLIYFGIVPLFIAFIVSSIYYYLLAIIHHYLDKDLSKQVIFEYFVILCITLVVILFVR